jgi:CHAT domain-containing protein/Flp pilus assembly protein TadD
MKRAAAISATALVALTAVLFAVRRPLAVRLAAADARGLYLSGDPDAAFERYDEALAAARRLGDLRLEARLLRSSAEIGYAALGRLDEARRRLERALELARAAGDGAVEADVLSSLGVFYWWYQRERERSLPEFYAPALEIYERRGDRLGVAGTRGRIGLVHLANRAYEACARELEASRALYEELGDRRALADVHAYLGALHAGLENLPLAHRHYRLGLELAEETGDGASRRRIEPLLAEIELRRGDYESALELFDRMAEAEPDPSVALRNHLASRGQALMHLGRPAEARAAFEQALDVQSRTPGADEPFRSRHLTLLSHACRLTGDLDAAARALEAAEAVGIAGKGWGEAVSTALARADLADLRGDPEAALGYLVTAAEIESRTFGSAVSYFFQSQYRQVFDRLFSLLFDADVAPEGAHELAFRLLEQMRYRSFRGVLVRLGDPREPRPPGAGELDAVRRIEELTRRLDRGFDEEDWDELRRAYAGYEDLVLRSELAAADYRRAAAARPVALAELRSRMPAAEALVEYVLTGERAFALVVLRDRVSTVALPVAASQLEAKVKLFRRLLFDEDGAWRPLAAELGRLLVEPLETDGSLAGVRRLAFVPMGFLHELPFAALETAGSGFLIERFTLMTTPSATLWDRRQTAPAGDGAVAFGLLQASTPEPLAPLAFAEEEAATVAKALGGEARLGPQATEASFKALAPPARIVHVAAHGLLEKRVPLHSRLRLEPGGGDDGNLTVREILGLDLAAELVTLSACETGWSGSAGLEVDRVGFVEAFLYAGAANVLASLLPVADSAGASFMTAFYEELDGQPPGEALAATQRRMSASADFSHPRYWAPFVLVGRD